MAEHVRGQGNRDQNRNMENQDINPVDRGRGRQQDQLESTQNISTGKENSQRGSLENQEGIERGAGSRSNRQLMEEE